MVAGAVALVLGVALAIVALPPAEEPIEPAAIDGDARGAQAAAKLVETQTAARPVWRAGDAWRVQFNDGDPICWMVVVSANESGYEQGVSCGDEGDFIAIDVAVRGNTYVGSFTTDLEGRHGDATTQWYDWPLVDGKTWTTEYAGVEMEVEATFAEDRFQLVMRDVEGQNDLLRYDYDPLVGWWTELAFESGYVFRIHEVAHGWEGPVQHAIAEPAASGDALFTAQMSLSFNVEETETHIAMIMFTPTNGVQYYDLTGPDGSVQSAQPNVPLLNTPTFRYEIYDAIPGVWSFRLVGAGPGEYRVELTTVTLATIVL